MKQRQLISDFLSIEPKRLILFSSKNKIGKTDVWKVIENLTGLIDQ
jgi:hypothetical protein